MKFEEALAELRKGKLIFRPRYSQGSEGNIHKSFQYTEINIKDCLAEDWEAIEEPGKTFPEVFEAFKEGKWIKRKCCDIRINNKAYNLGIEDILATDWMVCDD